MAKEDKFITQLENEIETKCNSCGDIETAGWKDCGCYTEGFNDGIKKAIIIYKELTK